LPCSALPPASARSVTRRWKKTRSFPLTPACPSQPPGRLWIRFLTATAAAWPCCLRPARRRWMTRRRRLPHTLADARDLGFAHAAPPEDGVPLRVPGVRRYPGIFWRVVPSDPAAAGKLAAIPHREGHGIVGSISRTGGMLAYLSLPEEAKARHLAGGRRTCWTQEEHDEAGEGGGRLHVPPSGRRTGRSCSFDGWRGGDPLGGRQHPVHKNRTGAIEGEPTPTNADGRRRHRRPRPRDRRPRRATPEDPIKTILRRSTARCSHYPDRSRTQALALTSSGSRAGCKVRDARGPYAPATRKVDREGGDTDTGPKTGTPTPPPDPNAPPTPSPTPNGEIHLTLTEQTAEDSP